MANLKATLKKSWIAKYPSLIGLVLILLIATFMSPYFWTFTNWANIMRQSVILGICSLGLTFVILTGHNDLSIQGVLAMCCVISAVLTNRGVPLPLADTGFPVSGRFDGCTHWNDPFPVEHGAFRRHLRHADAGHGFRVSLFRWNDRDS